MSTNSIRVAVDVGGTFTDICIFDDRSGKMRVEKLPSSADPIEAVLEGVGKAGVDLHDVALLDAGHEERAVVVGGRYVTPRQPGASTELRPESIEEFSFPSGPAWAAR